MERQSGTEVLREVSVPHWHREILRYPVANGAVKTTVLVHPHVVPGDGGSCRSPQSATPIHGIRARRSDTMAAKPRWLDHKLIEGHLTHGCTQFRVEQLFLQNKAAYFWPVLTNLQLFYHLLKLPNVFREAQVF